MEDFSNFCENGDEFFVPTRQVSVPEGLIRTLSKKERLQKERLSELRKPVSRYGTRNNVKNQHKENLFRAFLIDTFGLETFSQGSGILEVAGGSSELSFLFQNLNGIKATVVEPRKIRWERWERRLEFDFYHRKSVLSRYNTCEKAARVDPDHIRLFFEESLWSPFEIKFLADADEAEKFYRRGIQRALAVEWTSLGLEETGASKATCEWEMGGIEALTQEEATILREWPWQRVQQTLRDCSFVVGMHPDQAAESIVDFALAHNKSFAVVPCCEFARGLGFSVSVRIAVLDSPVVRALSSPPLARQTPFMSACGGDLVLIAGTYSQEFPKRKLHGVAVRTHEQLCDYLQAKNREIRRDILPFGGKNVVLWWNSTKPTDMQSQ